MTQWIELTTRTRREGVPGIRAQSYHSPKKSPSFFLINTLLWKGLGGEPTTDRLYISVNPETRQLKLQNNGWGGYGVHFCGLRPMARLSAMNICNSLGFTPPPGSFWPAHQTDDGWVIDFGKGA